MKLASYNVESLFLRARAMNLETWARGRDVLKQHSDLNTVLGEARYSAADKKKILTLLRELGLEKQDAGPYAVLRQNRGHLLRRPKKGPVEVVASGRGSWIGWVDLRTEEVNEIATRMTAQVTKDVDADVLAVIEAESRPALVRFSVGVLEAAVGGTPYAHVMLIDGNDERGIDVGIMTRAGYELSSMRSHVDDADAHGLIFSRDCAEYAITTPTGKPLVVLINHFKSKGYGSQGSNDAKRRRQATRVKQIYDGLMASGQSYVAVVGDLNDTPDSDALRPLLQETDLRDISEHPNFDDGGEGLRPGTFANGAKGNKLDYLLLSPRLFEVATGGGVFRKGVWGGTHGTLFEHYPEMTKPVEAASDHAAIWAELDL
jgi:endonuclease/exonuclease/phosphatase family metal-dependent hydrolase